MAERFHIPEVEIREREFAIYAALGFNLYLPRSFILPHLERICVLLGKCAFIAKLTCLDKETSGTSQARLLAYLKAGSGWV